MGTVASPLIQFAGFFLDLQGFAEINPGQTISVSVRIDISASRRREAGFFFVCGRRLNCVCVCVGGGLEIELPRIIRDVYALYKDERRTSTANEKAIFLLKYS